MKIFVHIKQKIIKVNVGDGAQSIQWLCDSAVMRHDESNHFFLEQVKRLKLESG